MSIKYNIYYNIIFVQKFIKTYKIYFKITTFAEDCLKITTVNKKKYQLHAVFLTQQGRQRATSVNTLHSPLSARFFVALRGECRNITPGFLPCCQSEEMKILINNDSYPRVGIEPTTVALYTHCMLVFLRHNGLINIKIN